MKKLITAVLLVFLWAGSAWGSCIQIYECDAYGKCGLVTKCDRMSLPGLKPLPKLPPLGTTQCWYIVIDGKWRQVCK